MTGREVTVTQPVTKAVALTAANCEIMYALGSGETLVGRGEYCDYPAEVNSVQVVQSGAETNIEQIIALAPQVVFLGIMAQTIEQEKQLSDAGIAVIASEADSIEGTYECISLMGKVLGKDKEAADIVNSMKETFEDLSAKTADTAVKNIYFEVSPLIYGLWSAGTGTFMNEITEILHLNNIFGDIQGWAEVSEEQVIARQPDFIVTVGMYFGDGLKPDEEIYARENWQSVPAVANKKVINIDDNSLARPGPRLADGALNLYNFIYGENG
jgi:iron complex transport system substrate-binding protein